MESGGLDPGLSAVSTFVAFAAGLKKSRQTKVQAMPSFRILVPNVI